MWAGKSGAPAPRLEGLGGVVFRRPVHPRGRWVRTVDAVAELLASPEEEAALRLHRDDLSGLGVTALVALVVLHVEGPKPADLDVFSPAERVLHRLEDRLDGRLGLLLGDSA